MLMLKRTSDSQNQGVSKWLEKATEKAKPNNAFFEYGYVYKYCTTSESDESTEQW